MTSSMQDPASVEIIPHIQTYKRSDRKIKHVMNRHKVEIGILKETNWNSYKDGSKNEETDIHNYYKEKIEGAVAENNYLRKGLKRANKSFKIEIKRLDIENRKKYEEQLNEKERKVNTDYDEAVNKVVDEANTYLEKESQKLQIKYDAVCRELERENKELKNKLSKERLQQMEQQMKYLRTKLYDLDKKKCVLNEENLQLNKTNAELKTRIKKTERLQQIDLKERMEDLQTKVYDLEKKQCVLNEQNYELNKTNAALKTRIKKTERLQQNELQQKEEQMKCLHKKLNDLEKETCMLNATVDEKIAEILNLDKTNAELKARIKTTERVTFTKSIESLELKNWELRKSLIDKEILIHQAQKTLSRAKSMGDLSYSEDEIQIRSEMLQMQYQESKEEEQQILDDYADTLYECTGKKNALQSLSLNLKENSRFPKKETDKINHGQDFAGKQKVKTTYNIFGSANFQNNCLVETIAAQGKTNPSITNG